MPSIPKYIMKVEQENFLRCNCLLLQRFRSRSGTRRCMLRAKSALMINASVAYSARLRANSGGAISLEVDFFHGFVQVDFNAQLTRNRGHPLTNGTAASRGMINTVLVL